MSMSDEQVRETLLKLIAENPKVPIRAIVDEEVVSGEYSTYMAYVWSVYKDRMCYYNDRYYDDEEALFDDWVENTYDFTVPIDEVDARIKFNGEFEDKWEDLIIVHVSV